MVMLLLFGRNSWSNWCLLLQTQPLLYVLNFVSDRPWSVWPDLAIYWTMGNFQMLLATINLPKSPTFLGIFRKGDKIYHFLEKSFLGIFYRHLATFFWSHCPWRTFGSWRSNSQIMPSSRLTLKSRRRGTLLLFQGTRERICEWLQSRLVIHF